MSLINQMLRDLDARHAPAGDRTGLPNAVRVRQRVKRRRSRPALVLALVAVAAGSWYWQSGHIDPVAPPQAPTPAPQPVAAVQPSPTSPPAPTREPAPPAAPEAKAATEAAPKPKAIPIAAAAKRPEVKPATPSPTVTAAAAPMPAAEAPAEPAAIDKKSRTAPAHEAAEAEYRKALVALRRGATGEAVDGLRAALRADRRHVSARQALLSLLVEQQQWNEAQTLCEEGLALDPTQAAWAMVLARLQTEHGKLPEAAETLAHYAAHAEQNADYQAFYALLLRKLKRPSEAAARYRSALALKPGDALWWYGLGLSLEADQKAQEARGAFLKARELGSLPPELATAVEQRLR